MILLLCFGLTLAAGDRDADQLAKQLVAAPDDATRDQILAQHTAISPPDLRQALIAEIRLLSNTAQYARVLLMARYLERYAAHHADNIGMIHAHLAMGNVQTELSDYEQAITDLLEAGRLSKEAGYELGQSAALVAVGIVEQRRGNFGKALESQQIGLEQAEAGGNSEAIATALYNMAVTYGYAGNSRRALELYNRIRTLTAGNPEWEMWVMANSAIIYSAQGDTALALESYRKAFRYLEERHWEREAEIQVNNIGEVLRKLGRYKEAEANFHEALRRSERLGTKRGVALSWFNLGLTYEAQGKLAQARAACQDSLRLREELGEQPGVVESLLCLSRLSLAAKNYRQALAASQQASAVAKKMQALPLLWEPLLLVGRAQKALQQSRAARESFEESVAAVENLREQVVGDARQRQQFFETMTAPYYALVDLLLEEGRTEAALQYAEMARARVLQDVFAGNHSSVFELPPVEKAEEQRLAKQLAECNRQLLQTSDDRVLPLQVAVQQARSELQTFRNWLYVQHPNLRFARANTGPITRAQIHHLLPTAQSALLEFVVGDRRSLLFVYTAGELRAYPIAVTRRTLAAQIIEFRTKITSRSAAYQPLAQSLYNTLLRPAERQLHGKNALHIMPDGDLWELPFQALLMPANRFVIEEFAVSYAPSLAVLRDMRQRRRSSLAPVTLLALGNPTVNARPLLVSTRGIRDTFQPLPEAESEVRSVARLFGSSRSTVLTRSDARESMFKSASARAGVLHLATHGVLNNASPLYSYLVLAQDDKPSGEDGLLEAWELMQLNLQADLAVLSACETGRGRIRPGEGVVGLSWALFVAGVPTIVVSQWKVESTSTSQLMQTFYRRWRGGQGTARALQSAARELLQNDRYAHPFFWAPFVAVGNAQ